MPGIFSHGYALLIGAGECAYYSLSLPVTVKDMQALRSVLIDPALCGYSDDDAYIRLLHDSGATRQAILDGLKWLAEQTEADEEARAARRGSSASRQRSSAKALMSHAVYVVISII